MIYAPCSNPHTLITGNIQAFTSPEVVVGSGTDLYRDGFKVFSYQNKSHKLMRSTLAGISVLWAIFMPVLYQFPFKGPTQAIFILFCPSHTPKPICRPFIPACVLITLHPKMAGNLLHKPTHLLFYLKPHLGHHLAFFLPLLQGRDMPTSFLKLFLPQGLLVQPSPAFSGTSIHCSYL